MICIENLVRVKYVAHNLIIKKALFFLQHKTADSGIIQMSLGY